MNTKELGSYLTEVAKLEFRRDVLYRHMNNLASSINQLGIPIHYNTPQKDEVEISNVLIAGVFVGMPLVIIGSIPIILCLGLRFHVRETWFILEVFFLILCYLRKKKKIEKEYSEQCLEHSQKLINDDLRCKNEKILKSKMKTEYAKAVSVYNNIGNILLKYYEYNIIAKKYRNLISVVMLQEYICIGRCYTLTGPDGAYNLYELELRQQLIINKLDTIIRRLDEIKSTQYYLYEGLNKNNICLNQLYENSTRISDQLDDISEKIENLNFYNETDEATGELLNNISTVNDIVSFFH